MPSDARPPPAGEHRAAPDVWAIIDTNVYLDYWERVEDACGEAESAAVWGYASMRCAAALEPRANRRMNSSR
jgi:hypothetical protein